MIRSGSSPSRGMTITTHFILLPYRYGEVNICSCLNYINMEKSKKKRHKKRKRKGPKIMDPVAVQKEITQREYDWLAQQDMRGGPSTPSAIPFDKRISVFPDETIAWVKSNCRFSSNS